MHRHLEQCGLGHGQEGLTDLDRRHGAPEHGRPLAGDAIGPDHDGGAGVCRAYRGAMAYSNGERRAQNPADTHIHPCAQGLHHYGRAQVKGLDFLRTAR